MLAIVEFFTPTDPLPDRDGTWRAAGASLLVLIVVVSLLVLQRLDAALSSIIDIRSVGGDAVANRSVPGGPGVVWVVATLVGVAALFVLVQWAVAVDPLVRKLAWVVIGIWVVSAVLGFDVLMKETDHPLLSFSGGETTIQSIRGALRTGGLLAALSAVLSVKGLGDPRKLWIQASVIRVQLTFLLLLVVLIYAFR